MKTIQDLFHKFYDPITPVSFDINEYYTIVITCLTVGLAIFLHKKHRKMMFSEALTLFLYNVYVTSLFEFILAIKPIDLYDTLDRNYGEIYDFFLQAVTYPCTIFIFMHFFLTWKMSKIPFILLGTATLVLMEWISEHYFSLFTYKGWKLIYSIPFYMFILTINVYFISWIHKKYIWGCNT